MFALHDQTHYNILQSLRDYIILSVPLHPLRWMNINLFIFILFYFIFYFLFFFESEVVEKRELTKMKIEFEARVVDWREGALHTMYLQHKLQILLANLEKTKLKPGNFGEFPPFAPPSPSFFS
jgi:hypothetical protein